MAHKMRKKKQKAKCYSTAFRNTESGPGHSTSRSPSAEVRPALERNAPLNSYSLTPEVLTCFTGFKKTNRRTSLIHHPFVIVIGGRVITLGPGGRF